MSNGKQRSRMWWRQEDGGGGVLKFVRTRPNKRSEAHTTTIYTSLQEFVNMRQRPLHVLTTLALLSFQPCAERPRCRRTLRWLHRASTAWNATLFAREGQNSSYHTLRPIYPEKSRPLFCSVPGRAPVEQLRVRVAAVEDEELLLGVIVPAGDNTKPPSGLLSVPGVTGSATPPRPELYHF